MPHFKPLILLLLASALSHVFPSANANAQQTVLKIDYLKAYDWYLASGASVGLEAALSGQKILLDHVAPVRLRFLENNTVIITATIKKQYQDKVGKQHLTHFVHARYGTWEEVKGEKYGVFLRTYPVLNIIDGELHHLNDLKFPEGYDINYDPNYKTQRSRLILSFQNRVYKDLKSDFYRIPEALDAFAVGANLDNNNNVTEAYKITFNKAVPLGNGGFNFVKPVIPKNINATNVNQIVGSSFLARMTLSAFGKLPSGLERLKVRDGTITDVVQIVNDLGQEGRDFILQKLRGEQPNIADKEEEKPEKRPLNILEAKTHLTRKFTDKSNALSFTAIPVSITNDAIPVSITNGKVIFGTVTLFNLVTENYNEIKIRDLSEKDISWLQDNAKLIRDYSEVLKKYIGNK
jgi:hypothetical protein